MILKSLFLRVIKSRDCVEKSYTPYYQVVAVPLLLTM